MKYLSNYLEEAQTELFNEMGVFFAFSNEQLEEGKKKIGVSENKELISLGQGLILPKKNKEEFLKKHDELVKTAIQQDIKENGIEAIIMRELGNYETQITGDISGTVNALTDYGITSEQIADIYKNKYFPMCVENDWF